MKPNVIENRGIDTECRIGLGVDIEAQLLTSVTSDSYAKAMTESIEMIAEPISAISSVLVTSSGLTAIAKRTQRSSRRKLEFGGGR